MTSQFIYSMPCLSKYRFNHKGECISIATKQQYQLHSDPKRVKEPHYKLKEDGKKHSSIVKLREVQKYIAHLKQVQEFNPLVFHHFIIYRPTIRYKWKAAC